MNSDAAFYLCLISLAIGLFLGALLNKEIFENKGRNEVREEAIQKGHAEYYLDANHNKQWRWKEAR